MYDDLIQTGTDLLSRFTDDDTTNNPGIEELQKFLDARLEYESEFQHNELQKYEEEVIKLAGDVAAVSVTVMAAGSGVPELMAMTNGLSLLQNANKSVNLLKGEGSTVGTVISWALFKAGLALLQYYFQL